MLSGFILILISLVGTARTAFCFKRNMAINRSIESKSKRILNYPLTILWYGYLFVFFVGLSVNNLIFD